MVDSRKPSKKKTSKSKVAGKSARKKNPLPASPTINGDMTQDELEFVQAIDTFKRKNNRPFPTWREILSILKDLGYRKPSDVIEDLGGGQDSPEAQLPPADLV